jgi:hypothetical protein
MTTTIDWPDETTFAPTDEDLADERRYWDEMALVADYNTWTELRARLESFERWPLEDLLDELETLRILTPDQEDIIAELEDEISRRQAA